ncbi:hypothetical protein [Rhizobium sp. OAE497]|uniref:virion core protein, T7 gp14 family n=1 Tax=Rhizobium sp. OAE497 TaxID=2663796 RepID=UPI0018F320D6
MCDLSLALAIGSTVIGAAGQVQQASAESAADKYNAQVADMNATLADKKARDDITAGQQEEQRKRLETAQLEGKQKAAMAANGVDLNFGSPLDTLVDTAKIGELDALNIRTNAYRAAYNDKVQATNFQNEAIMDRAKSSYDAEGGYLGAVGTILGGAGKAFSPKDMRW